MARLAPPENFKLRQTERSLKGRYTWDVDALVTSLGGYERLKELCRQFGVPPLPKVRSQVAVTHVPVLLELAHRMGRPVDAHSFVVQVR